LVGRQQAQASVGQRGAQEVAAEILEALAIFGAHYGGGLEVEAIHSRLQLPPGLAVVVGVGAFWRVLARVASRGRAREREAECALLGLLDGPALEELVHALSDGGAERLELGARGRSDGCAALAVAPPGRDPAEHVVAAVREEHVKVHVEGEVAPEPLHGGDVAGARVDDAELAALVAIPALDHASRYAVHRERQVVVVGERHA
jgi:hypothetical protein